MSEPHSKPMDAAPPCGSLPGGKPCCSREALSARRRTSRSQARVLATVLMAGLLSACGGGSSSNSRSNDPVSATPVPQGNQAPVARLSLSVSDGFAPLTVSFDGTGSTDSDGTIARYDWEFGDDSPVANGPAVTRTFENTGSFSVRLTVTDDEGATSSASSNVRVRGASVAGVISIAPGSSADSDVNDRLTTPVSNSSFGDAQPLAKNPGVPLRLGGFVNQPGTGPESGNFFTAGDADDYFFLDLAGGERIVLSIGDPSADLDLELYSEDASPRLIDASISVDQTEDLTVPATAGGYFVRVVAAQGASTYVLSIAGDEPSSQIRRHAKRLTDPFVPGELLMSTAGSRELGRYGIERETESGRFRLTPRERAVARSLRLRMRGTLVPDTASASAELQLRYRTLLAAKHAAGEPGVTLAEVNVIRRPMRVPGDEFFPLQWHLADIDMEAAWDISTGEDTGRAPVVVAIVDTGIRLEHPDIEGQLLRDDNGNVVGYDFIQDADRANDGDGLDANPEDPGDATGADGSGSFHGTHVAGTVAADSDNDIGVAGVAWGARLMPLRALGVDGGTTFDVMQAARYAAGLSNVSGRIPPVRADIINMSLGSDFYSEAEQRTLNEIRSRGVFVVASAGNDTSDVPSYPASYDGVISVGASNSARGNAGYSNFGSQIDLVAPGGDLSVDLDGDGQRDGVLSTLADGGGGAPFDLGYGFLEGTSMAAPHVTGVIALMKSVYPELSPAEFDSLLESGQLTDDAGPAGRDDNFGWGIINANRALQAAVAALASQGDSIGPVLSVSAGSLNFQAFTDELTFSVSNIGTGDPEVTVATDRSWLSASPINATAAGLGEYRAMVDRGGLDDGRYSGTIRLESSQPGVTPRTISVSMLVTSPDADASAGQHYVVLVGSTDGTAQEVQVVNPDNGRYRFTLTDVPPGEYRLFAGSDLDDDDFICDGGEACGAYPSLSSPAVLVVEPRSQSTLENLSFATEFRTTATTTSTDATARTGDGGSGLRLNKPTGSTSPSAPPARSAP